MSKSFWVAVVLTTIILGISCGILVHVYGDMKLENASIAHLNKINEVLRDNEIIQTSTKEEKKTTPNTEIVFERYYNRCGHTDIKKQFADKEDVNKNEEEIKNKYNDWVLRSFSPDMIELYKEENKMCENHFIVKEKDGVIVIYTVDEEGKETLKETTEISTKYLPKEDIELLQRGIKANSISDLQNVLSDYE